MSRELTLACMAISPGDILQGLIEEPMVAHEYPIIMDDIFAKIEANPHLSAIMDEDFFSNIDIELEKLQICAHAMLQNFLNPRYQESFTEFKIHRWIGSTSAIMESVLQVEGHG